MLKSCDGDSLFILATDIPVEFINIPRGKTGLGSDDFGSDDLGGGGRRGAGELKF